MLFFFFFRIPSFILPGKDIQFVWRDFIIKMPIIRNLLSRQVYIRFPDKIYIWLHILDKYNGLFGWPQLNFFKVLLNGKTRGYMPESHMNLISLHFRGFLFCGLWLFIFRLCAIFGFLSKLHGCLVPNLKLF